MSVDQRSAKTKSLGCFAQTSYERDFVEGKSPEASPISHDVFNEASSQTFCTLQLCACGAAHNLL